MGSLGERVKGQRKGRPDTSVAKGLQKSSRETRESNDPVDVDGNRYQNKVCFQRL